MTFIITIDRERNCAENYNQRHSKFIFFRTAIIIWLISNHNSFRVQFDKIGGRLTDSIGVTTLCDPWDASPPTLEITGPSVISPLQLLQLALIFRCTLWEAYSASQTPLLNLRGKE